MIRRKPYPFRTACKGGGPVFLEREKGSCGKYDQAVVRAFANVNWGRSSQMRWVRFTAEFIGVKSEKARRVPSVSEGSRFRRGWVMNFVALRMLTGDRAKY